MMTLNKIYHGDTRELLKKLPDNSINCCVTSPPYWGLRDYGVDGQVGLEETPEKFVDCMVEIFREVKRALRPDGTLWLNLGDSYLANPHPDKGGDPKYNNGRARFDRPNTKGVPGLKTKDLVGIPWRVAFALQTDGWWLRQDIIWAKSNPMPESVKDRCTKSHEYIFLLSKSAKYYFDNEAMKEPGTPDSVARYNRGRNNGHKWTDGGPGNQSIAKSFDHMKSKYSFARKTATQGKPGTRTQHREERESIEYCGTRNKRSVWLVPTNSYKKAHFATFPPKLILPCILAGCPKDGVVLDPFMGSGTTGFVALENNRNFIGFELNEDYIKIANDRIKNAEPQLF